MRLRAALAHRLRPRLRPRARACVARAMLHRRAGGPSMNATIELRTVPARNALVVHAHTSMSAIPRTIGSMFGEVASWAGAHGVAIDGPAITRYSNLAGLECDLAAGFIVDRAPEVADPRVQVMDVGGCTALVATHV